MNTNRRRFLKNTALGTGLLLSSFTGYNMAGDIDGSVSNIQKKAKERKQLFNMCGFAAPTLPVVRIGYVGIGHRGSSAVARMTNICGVEIKALCDIREEAVREGQNILLKAGWPGAKEYYGNNQAWKKCVNAMI